MLAEAGIRLWVLTGDKMETVGDLELKLIASPLRLHTPF